MNKLREPFLESIDLLAGDDILDRETYGRLIVWKGIATSAARKEGQSKARNQRAFPHNRQPAAQSAGIERSAPWDA